MNRRLGITLAVCALLLSTLACLIGTTTPSPEPTRLKPVIKPPATAPFAAPTGKPTSIPTSPARSSTSTPAPNPTLAAGSTQTALTDGMNQLFVPEGTFTMGGDDWDEVLHAPVWLDAYWIDQTEVTNAMFAKFTAATHYVTDGEKKGSGYVYQISSDQSIRTTGANWQHPHGPGSNIKSLDQHPVVQASWNDAAAYCKWAGRRLPTEAEWEKAARGTDGRLYPWGNEKPANNLANVMDKQLNPAFNDDDGYQFTSPAGSYPDGASPYGALDMIGNAEEWTHDWYNGVYPTSHQTETVRNPQGAASGDGRAMRGGNWSTKNDYDDHPERLAAAKRISNQPNLSSDYSGFRCASSQ